jgi:hypothetical protein
VIAAARLVLAPELLDEPVLLAPLDAANNLPPVPRQQPPAPHLSSGRRQKP